MKNSVASGWLAVTKEVWLAVRGKLWRFTLRRARTIVDAADEWVHEQEVGLREQVAAAESRAEVDPVASAARERVNKRSARAARPRLKYQHGQFVRES